MATKKTKSGTKKKTLEGHFGVVVADPPWAFSDKLTMSEVKRGAAANYPTLNKAVLGQLGHEINMLAREDALLALWCPSALFEDGYKIAHQWGFTPKGIYTWVKTSKGAGAFPDLEERAMSGQEIPLAFGMGRYFRGATEHAIIAVKGSVPKHVKNRSQRNVELHPALPHSAKPDGLQKSLELMFPDTPKLELFARRDRPGWTCVGNECPSTNGLDIRDWLASVLPGAEQLKKDLAAMMRKAG